MLHFIDYIYFFYGLAFFLFGFSILHYPTENSIFKFARDTKYLGWFGIFHGIYEWIAMARQIEQGSLHEIIVLMGFIVMSLSYIFLLFFALRIIWGRQYALKILPVAIVIWLIGILILDIRSLNNIDIFTRYILGTSGIFLTAYVFSRPSKIIEGSIYNSVKQYTYLLSITFFIYGILAGLIVPVGSFFPASLINMDMFKSLTGLPVQFFRALCAIIASYAIAKILHVFKQQTDYQLLKLSKALEESGDTVMITDTEGKIEYINRAFELQSGFPRNEVIGKTPNILSSGEHPNSFYQHLWQTILSGEIYQGVVTNKRKNATLYHEFKTIVPLKNNQGKLTSFISTGKDITSRIIFEHELEKAAATDPLTGAANRLQCDRWLRSAIEHAKISNAPISLILFDIDNFKNVNDTFGHNSGDEVLIKISEIVRTIIRSSDMFARWGGEEFVILQVDTPIEGTITLAERLRKEIEYAYFKEVGQITVSLGVAQYDGGSSIESFVKKADDAMYEAKKQGKNRVYTA